MLLGAQCILGNMIKKENLHDMFAYADDVTICRHNDEQHNETRQSFKVLPKKYGIISNEPKSVMIMKEMPICGYLIRYEVSFFKCKTKSATWFQSITSRALRLLRL